MKATILLAAAMSALALAACSAAAPPPSATAATDSVPSPASTSSAPTHAALPTADAATRTAPVVPGRPGRVFIFAGVDEACKPIAPPALSITRAPAQGEISFKDGQQTILAATARGTCAGAKASGTGVYYTARPGSSGADSFSVNAKLASGETITRNFTVDISQ